MYCFFIQILNSLFFFFYLIVPLSVFVIKNPNLLLPHFLLSLALPPFFSLHLLRAQTLGSHRVVSLSSLSHGDGARGAKAAAAVALRWRRGREVPEEAVQEDHSFDALRSPSDGGVSKPQRRLPFEARRSRAAAHRLQRPPTLLLCFQKMPPSAAAAIARFVLVYSLIFPNHFSISFFFHWCSVIETTSALFVLSCLNLGGFFFPFVSWSI